MGAVTLNLSREHLGKIVRLDTLTIIELPSGVFKQGEMLMCFNNSNNFTTLISHVKCSYRSAMSNHKTHFEVPPRALFSLIFVDDDIVVYTVGL